MSESAEASADFVVCQLCQDRIQARYAKFANGHQVCPTCALQLQGELERGAASTESLPPAIAAGAVGALVGAAAWALVVIASDWEIGYLAVLVGFLAGYGVKLGARGAHGKTLQVAAVACAFGGLLAAKYLIFAHFFQSAAHEQGAPQIGYFSGITLASFPGILPSLLSPFDLLWVFIALTSAWRVPATPRVNVS